MILIDIGIKYLNYTADITRFFLIGENISGKEKGIAKNLLEIQNELVNSVKEGINSADLDRKHRELLESKGYKVYHSLGHGIGINVHEKPYISIRAGETLKSNMVFTIEPEIYLNNFGLRFEDDVTIRKGEVKILSNFLRDLDELII